MSMRIFSCDKPFWATNRPLAEDMWSSLVVYQPAFSTNFPFGAAG